MENLKALAEGELIKRAQQGDRQAFGELQRRYWQPTYKAARARVPTRDDAYDATQSIFAEAWASITSYSPALFPFNVWLGGVATHEIADLLEKRNRDATWHPSKAWTKRNGPLGEIEKGERRFKRVSLERAMESHTDARGREVEGIADESQRPVEAEALDHYTSERIEVYLWRLPEDQGQAVELVMKQGRPYAEAAKIMGKDQGTVKSLVHRGLAAIRERFDNGAERARVERMLAGRTRHEYPVRKWFIYWVFDGARPDAEHMDDIVWLSKGEGEA